MLCVICVICALCSSHAQWNVSIEQQVAGLEAYAHSLGLRVMRVCTDRAFSGTGDKRPQFHVLPCDAARRRIVPPHTDGL